MSYPKSEMAAGPGPTPVVAQPTPGIHVYKLKRTCLNGHSICIIYLRYILPRKFVRKINVKLFFMVYLY